MQRRAARRRQVILIAVAVLAMAGILYQCGAFKADKKAAPAACTPKPQTYASPPPMSINKTKTYVATVTTDVGTFKIKFDPTRAPLATNNFVFLAKKHFYDCVTFHRVIPSFVVQGGDPAGTGASQYPGYKFDDEALDGTKYVVGDVAMANAGPNTNGSQFFVITGDAGAALPPKYTLFGKVTSGMDVIRKIEADGGTQNGGGTDLKFKHQMRTVTIEES